MIPVRTSKGVVIYPEVTQFIAEYFLSSSPRKGADSVNEVDNVSFRSDFCRS
jgi:hypothetical protein